jgi:hypothetical protein
MKPVEAQMFRTLTTRIQMHFSQFDRDVGSSTLKTEVACPSKNGNLSPKLFI